MPVITIDIARGIAALWVVLYHWPQIAKAFPVLTPLVHLGYLAVPGFFVISGYCMDASVRKIIDRGDSAFDFLKRRFLRIYPAFWASSVVVGVTPFLVEMISALKSGTYVRPQAAWLNYSLSDWSLFISLIGSYFIDLGKHPKEILGLNAPLWSLVVEFQFYLVLFALLFLRRFYDIGIAAISAMGMLCVVLLPSASNWGFFLIYWPQFMVGICLHRVLSRGHTADLILGSRNRALAAFLILLGAFLSVLNVPAIQQAETKHHLLITTLFPIYWALMFWLVAPFESSLKNLLSNGPFAGAAIVKSGLFLGAISYSLYLLHGKLFLLPWMAVRQIVPDTSPLSYPMILLLLLGMTWLFYQLFERPFVNPASPRSRIRGEMRPVASGA